MVKIRDLNRLLQSEIYVHDDQLRAAHLILRYKPIYNSFQKEKDIIKAGDKRIPFIDVWHENYVPSPTKLKELKKRKKRSDSPPPFTSANLGVFVVILSFDPTPPTVSPGTVLTISKVILIEVLDLGLSYQRIPPKILDLLEAPIDKQPEVAERA